MSQSRISTVYIKPGSLDSSHARILNEYIDANPALTNGKILAAGNYFFDSVQQSQKINFYLSRDIVCTGELNPNQVTAANENILKLFMQNIYCGRYFPVGRHVLSTVDHVSGKITYTSVSISHGIGVRDNGYNKIVCDVYENSIIGKGAFGEVKNILGTLKYRYNKTRELVFEPSGDRRVVKELRLGNKEEAKFMLEVGRETAMLDAATHTRTRQRLYGSSASGEKLYAISMKKFKGFNLLQLISDDDQMLQFKRQGVNSSIANGWLNLFSHTKLPALTIDDRFQICIELLKQLRRQVHGKSLVHRDIKPENIIINRENGRWRVNIIDFNLSRSHDDGDKKRCGTPAFVAKEVIDADLDEQSDLFSMALVIALLWRDDVQKSVIHMNPKDAFEHRFQTQWDIDLEMFDGLEGLPGNIKLSLSLLLSYMLAAKDKRPSLDKCLAQFDEIYSSYRLSLLPLTVQQSTSEGYVMAKSVDNLLSKVASEKISHLTVCKLRDDLLNIVDRVADDQQTIQAFIQAVDVDCFQGLQMKDQLKSKIKEVTDNFLLAYQHTEKLLSQLREIYASIGQQGNLAEEFRQRVTVLSEQIHEVAVFAEKIAKTPLDIDSIASQTQHLQNKNGKIERAMLYFEQLQPSREDISRVAATL